MGSGISGLYNGTYGGRNETAEETKNTGYSNAPDKESKSQPYSASYGVVEDMVQHDINRGVYTKEKGYSINPTAQNATDSLAGGVLTEPGGKALDGHYVYVVSSKGSLIIGKRNGNGKDGQPTPHPTLIGGKDPRVKIAGIVTIAGGKIVKYDTASGHYRPNILSMPAADDAFSKLPNTAFHRNFNKNMGRI